MPPATGTADTRAVPMRPAAAAAWPIRPGAVIAVAALLGLGLRIFQLTRPGYLTGFTQYDDGVYIGNALRLVNGVIPYRDFAMVQRPVPCCSWSPPRSWARRSALCRLSRPPGS